MISTNCIFCRTSEDIDYVIRITDNTSNINNENMENPENAIDSTSLLLEGVDTNRIDNNQFKYVQKIVLSGVLCLLFYVSVFDARNHVQI